jgi:hypothetical protein
MAYMLAHKGKATASETTYNPDDPPEAYNNPSIHSRFTTYAETGRQIHEPEWDPIRASFDGETVMRIGGGRSTAITTWATAFWTQPVLPLSRR